MTASLIEEEEFNTTTEVSLRSLSTHGKDDEEFDPHPDLDEKEKLKGSLIVATDRANAPLSG